MTAGSFRDSVSRPPCNLSSDTDPLLAVCHSHLGCEGSLRPVHDRSKHLAGLVTVVVDGLLAKQNDFGVLSLHDRLEQLCYRQWLKFRVRQDVHPPVSAHGEGSPNCVLASLRSHRHGDDFLCKSLLFESDGLFHRYLAEGVYAHLYVRRINSTPIRLDSDLRSVVYHPLDSDDNPHGCFHTPPPPSPVRSPTVVLRRLSS